MGVIVLLDTNAWLRVTLEPEAIAPDVRALIVDPEVSVLVSGVSAMEVATKVRIGKLAHGRPLVDGWLGLVRRFGADPIDLTTEEALRAGGLDWEHRDPFDRLLAAQALERRVPLVTSDGRMSGCPDLEVVRT